MTNKEILKEQKPKVNRCIVTAIEMQDLHYDDYAIPRLLKQKGFSAKGRLLQPELTGIIGYSIDFENNNRNYFQINV